MPGLGLFVVGRRGLRALLVAVGVAAATGVVVPGPHAAAVDGCPSSNPPDTLRLVAGSPQTAQLRKPLQTNLQVALANSNGCPVSGSLAGVSIGFVAPASGASGTFASNGSTADVVGTNAEGVATAPTFTANDTAGSYSIQADSDYGSLELHLTNSAGGVVASIAATGTTAQDASVKSHYGHPLQARVLDASGRPVQGVTVSFSLGTGTTGASAKFLGGDAAASATTNADGQATSPPFVANASAGHFTATAAVTSAGGAGGGGGDGGAKPVGYRLQNVAGRPATITPGAANGETAAAGSRFPILLAVTIKDANGNLVARARVTFTAPGHGPSGHFNARARSGRRLAPTARTVSVKADARGIALAPPFTANGKSGGYIVIASAGGRRAAIALVNR